MTGPLGCTKDRSRPVLTSPFKPPLGQGPGPGPGTGPIILRSRSGPTDLGPGLFTGPGPVQGPDPATLLVTLQGRNCGAQKTGTWKGLDRVAVQDIDGLYALGLSCPIRHLTLKPAFTCQGKDHGSPAQYFTNAPAVLQDCTPSHLVLSHNLCPVHGSLSISNWNTLFTDSVVEGLTHLVLSINYQTFIREPCPPAGEEEMERHWQVMLVSISSPCVSSFACNTTPSFSGGTRSNGLLIYG